MREIIAITDDSNDWIQREGPDGKTYRVFNPDSIRQSKLRTAARWWLVSKLMPKLYLLALGLPVLILLIAWLTAQRPRPAPGGDLPKAGREQPPALMLPQRPPGRPSNRPHRREALRYDSMRYSDTIVLVLLVASLAWFLVLILYWL